MTWADLTYEQAAEALGVPVGTVRSRVNRARSKLRRALGDIDPTTNEGIASSNSSGNCGTRSRNG
ncbi:sigma factor-like helix-turn-helix DNA-binding protein [Nonomuraea angiospora]|uniref:sigma factor-like helix-turn-helix DNA-binding protein n=1 Tax=Nonomuraea angiospora TaxID=46172 RepID=UPI00298F3E79|nr:sigma factor-like helix-turn-helix DNA-binding protein [Nonomuraea angiospora]